MRKQNLIQTTKSPDIWHMLCFNKKYFLFTIILFIIELLIALFVRDSFVRPYLGDYLVVFLVYCAVRTILDAPVINVAIGVLLFAYAVEILQYFQIVNKLGLQNNVIARTVIGYGFEWIDLVAYTLGILSILAMERKHLAGRKRDKR